MRFFLDTANIDDIKKWYSTGLIDGVTTNPSLMAKEGRSIENVIKKICSIVGGPVSVEVLSTNEEGMVKEGEEFARYSPNIVIKIPLTYDGLKACYALSKKKVKTNVTLCFSAGQALLAAQACATYVSPFIGRLDDLSYKGISLIEDIRLVFDRDKDIKTKILAASVRHPLHVVEVARLGANVVTLPPSVLDAMIYNPLTDIGLDKFLKDWKKSLKQV
ncbi:MAG: fructose-6-phosphate aldolase [Alphaproteobacteria bacterium]